MHIETTNRTHKLSRYGGTVGGKQAQCRIGSVPVGTKPDAIPAGVIANLTPTELQELSAFLSAEHAKAARKRVSDPVQIMVEVAPSLAPDVLDLEMAERLGAALIETSAALRRIRRQQQAASCTTSQQDS